ncbi:MAG: hypothetical protein ACRDCE_16810 [Cetobacterium sp.]|uniref:hypothetical protein n=1 Tax=Cetobacterium sp. TaxID=2071632 RepID=UPI003EE4F0B3
MSSIVKFTYSIREKLDITQKEIVQKKENLKNVPHYKLFKYLKVYKPIENKQLETSLEKARQKNKIIDFTLKYLKEKQEG